MNPIKPTVAFLILLISQAPIARAQILKSKSGKTKAPIASSTDCPQTLIAASSSQTDVEVKLKSARKRQKLFAAAPLSAPVKGSIPPTAVLELAQSSLEFISNRSLNAKETSGQTSLVCEPTVAVRDEEVFVTGNRFAARSVNGDQTLDFVDPYRRFCNSAQGTFWTDQVTLYDPHSDLFFWILQYQRDRANRNVVRLAVANSDDFRKDRWHYYDLSPMDVGKWDYQFFDYPELAVGSNYLYLSISTAWCSEFQRSIMIRFPLRQLNKYQAVPFDYVELDADQSADFFRPTQGATDPMYWGMHYGSDAIRIFSWPEAEKDVKYQDVSVNTWKDEVPSAPVNGEGDWLGLVDGSITAAWATKDYLGFAWTAAADDWFSQPHVRVAILDKSMQKVAQPHIWNDQFAFAYPAAFPNSDGTVGISLSYGGGAFKPSHAVGILIPPSASEPWHWQLVTTTEGTHAPANNYWGDFLSIRRHGTQPESWVATGFTLQNGNTEKFVEVQYVHFRVKPSD